MENKYKSLSKNLGLFTISNFGAKILTFLLVPLYTAFLTQEDYGIIDLINTTCYVLIPILTVNIQDAILRFSLEKSKDKRDIISIGIKICIIATLFLSFSITVLKIFDLIRIDNIFLVFLIMSFLFGSLFNCFNMFLKSINRINVLVISGVLQTVCLCVLNIIFLVIFHFGINGYILSYLISYLLSLIYITYFGKIGTYFKMNNISNKLIKEMIFYGMPLIFNSLSWWINNASDRYILSYFSGIAINGIYAISYKIPTILSTFQNLFYNAWSISAITEFNNKDHDGFYINIYNIYNFITLLGCALLIIFNKLISGFFFNNSFYEAWKYVPILLLGTYFSGLALFLGCIFTATKNTKMISVSTIIGAFINTILNLILIPFFGAYGASFATLIGYFIMWITRFIFVHRIIDIKFDYKKEFFNSILMFILTILSLYENEPILVEGLILLAILIINRNIIYNLYKKLVTH